jgi:hypothetical protein
VSGSILVYAAVIYVDVIKSSFLIWVKMIEGASLGVLTRENLVENLIFL